jgi:hypothetical protein
VTWTSPAIETTASTYDWQQVLLLEAENNVITLRLLDRQRINLSYSHASSPAPKQVVRGICDETGLRSIDTIVIPEPQDRPITFTGNGIGLSIEGPIAVLKGADPKRATTTVFNNMARQVLITDRSPVVYRGIDSIEVEQTNDEAATYGVFSGIRPSAGSHPWRSVREVRSRFYCASAERFRRVEHSTS